MKPRQLKVLTELPPPQRDAALAEGLQHLADHVAALRADLIHLLADQRVLSAAVIDALATEEVAKMLILLDMVRAGWSDPAATARLVWNFYDHLARGIYGRAADTSPATFGEVRKFVDFWRRDLFLDGPNDVDWIVRNEIKTSREDAMYVDYVVSEQGGAWASPTTNPIVAYQPGIHLVIDLAGSLARLGCTTVEGIQISTAEWAGVSIDDATEWSVVEDINRRIIRQLIDRNLVAPDATSDDVRLVREHWTYPLTNLNLKTVKVPEQELHDRRDRWLADQI
jgi:AbiV family abortive infection protein